MDYITSEELQNASRRKYIDPIIFQDEQWKLIEIFDLPPIYWISTYGRVYNQSTRFIMGGHIVENGYEVVSFKDIYGNRIYRHVHRLVMLTFCPIKDAELFVVNHKDGNKRNNHISNLEWTTQKGNVEHAFSIGLRSYGENSSHAIFTEDQIHKVCKCMQDGMNIYQLSYMVFDRPPDQQIITLCTNIYNRKFWTSISDNYIVENYKRNMIFSVPQIHAICKILSVDIRTKTSDILKFLNIESYTKSEYEIYNRAIRNIRKGKSCKNISKLYNIKYI